MASIYCIDTSAIIDAWQEDYRPSSFPSLWSRVEEAINANILICPDEVKEEIKYPPELFSWASDNEKMFFELNSDLQAELKIVLNDLQDIMKKRKLLFTGKELKADPFVVALARLHSAKVITHESRHGRQGRPKIPDLCDMYEIEPIRFADFIQEQNWSF